ncbi:hypothetical protein MSG28_008435, partial [Choristoneura fumiferana]
MRLICVLLWKHAMVRKRRWFYSIVEFTFSLLLIVLPYLTKDAEFDAASGREVERLSRKRAPTLRRILYSPETNLTNWLMDEVGAKLGTPRLNHLPENDEVGMSAVSKARIEDYMRDMQNIDAVVLYQYEDGTLPSKLNYTIRLGKDFDTSSVSSPLVPRYPVADSDQNPLEKDSVDHVGATQARAYHTYEGHIYRLQWAIDIAYLGLQKGVDTRRMPMPDVIPLDNDDKNQIDLMKILLGFEVAFSCRLGLLIIFTFLMTNLLNDKNSGIQELMKMEGVSIKTIFIAHFLNVLPGGLVYAIGYRVIIKTSDNDNPIFPRTDGFLIFISLVLHFLSIMPWAFIGAYLINTGILITVTSFLFYFAPSIFLDIISSEIQEKASRVMTVLSTSLFPHQPLKWIMIEIGIREAFGQGVTFGNMGKATGEKHGSVLEGLVAMLAQIALYTLLAWYLAMVRPGKYGQPMPCNFLCKWSYWRSKPEIKMDTVEEEIYEPNKQYFEEAPKGLLAGIQIINVTKIFAHNVAVANLTLNVYKGEITVLLGHNGAGKTTLMNIISGLIGASAGTVLVNGMDTSLSREEVRSQLGLCPQHNLHFADLTVKEHVVFFGLLKGGKWSQVKEDSRELLKLLNMLDKANNMAGQLSGGMKRRLQLACALAGGASVLVLDEPTSGLDVETRRELWDLLLKLRGTRTVLLTTHFMEEADALADRIAAMHRGALRCHATPMFLKKAIGSGYRLTFTTAGPPNETALTAAIRSVVPDATVRDHALKFISYTLPARDSAKFPTLFSNLEAKRTELGIYTIGVGKSNLEEVFMTLCSDVTSKFETDQTSLATMPVPSFPKLTGRKLCSRQFTFLLKRQFNYITSKMKIFFFLQAFLPVLIICLLAKMCNNSLLATEGDSPPPALVALRRNHSGEEAPGPNADGPDVMQSLDITTISSIDSTVANGIQANDIKQDHYESIAPHTTFRLLANALAASTNNTPVQLVTPKKLIHSKMPIITGMWYVMYSLVVTNVLSGYVQLPSAERATGTRHIHLMCGCPLIVYWTATLVTHIFLGILFFILPNIVAQLLFDEDSTLNHAGFLISSSVILLLALMAMCSVMYLTSVLFAARLTFWLLIIMNMIFSMVTPIIHLANQIIIRNNKRYEKGYFYYVCVILSYVVPYHTMVMALSESSVVARLNAMCKLNKRNCPLGPVKIAQISTFNADACCASAKEDYASYWEFGTDTPGEGVLILACQFVVYSVLLLLADHGLFKMLFDRCQNCRLKFPPPRFDDPVVTAEKEYVEETVQKPKNQITDAILCHGVHKRFKTCPWKSYHAVKGINFSVKKGECFGLLGVNGAGKSTTFKMLSAELFPTRGSVYSNGQFNDLLHKTKYMRTLSYCPQFFGLDDFLTGRQNLELVLTLRGLKPADVIGEASSWIEEV